MRLLEAFLILVCALGSARAQSSAAIIGIANGAYAMSEVWIATDDLAPLQHLLAALGATHRTAMVPAPEPTEATVFDVQNGRVIVLPARHQVLPGRAVLGAVMSVHPPEVKAPSVGRASAFAARPGLVGPQAAHGLWLELRRAP